MAQDQQVRKIVITANTGGNADLKKFADSVGSINKNVKSLASSFGLLSTAAGAFLGFLSIREIAGFSDQMQNLSNRVLVLAGSQEEANKVMGALFKISQETNGSIEGSAEAFTRMSSAVKGVGVDTAVMIDLVKTLQNSFRLSGATTEEAKNATIQLSQAFSLGVLRGQDLKSVMSQNVVLTQALRKEFGKDLLKKAEGGFITISKVMEIVKKNMAEINSQAQLLAPTMEQTLTKAMNVLKFQINDLNKSMGIAATFAQIVEFALANLDKIIGVMGLITIPLMAAKFAEFVKLATAFALTNPVGAAFLAAGLAVIYFSDSLGGLQNTLLFIDTLFLRMHARILEVDAGFKSLFKYAFLFSEGFQNSIKKSEDAAKVTRDFIKSIEEDVSNVGKSIPTNDFTSSMAKWEASIKKVKEKLDAKVSPKIKDELAAINIKLAEGKLNIDQYQNEIDRFNIKKLQLEMEQGKIDIHNFNIKMQEINIGKVNRLFNEGALSVEEYNHAISTFQLTKLNEELYIGKKTLAEYNIEFAKLSDKFSAGGAFRAGLQGYLNSLGTTTQQVAKVIEGAFSKLEDVFLSFIKTGTFSFQQFTQAILDDLTRIIIRASIIQPLAQGLLSFIPTTSTASTGATQGPTPGAVPNAKGGAYDMGGIKKFASGGIVHGATPFSYGANKGIMGEAGPEAILPLGRTRTGDLGVSASVTPVTINIVNNSGSQVETRESTGPGGEKTIEVLIQNKVRDGIANGSFDKAMQATYGIRRKGA